MPIRNAKPVGTLMRENAAFRTVHHRLAALARLQQSLADTLPPGLKDLCRVANLEGSTLVIAAANGATATRLKQMLPRLLEALRTDTSESQCGENKIKEQQVTSISVLVQPNFRDDQTPTNPAVPRQPIPTEKLAELVDKLGESPLKSTLGRLSQKRVRGLT